MVATERVRRGHIRSADLPTHRGASVDLPARLDGPGALDRWHDRVHDPAALIVLDLFCGAGGMSEGFEAEGFVVAAGIDADAAACATYAANATGKTLCHDLACVHTPDQAQALVAGLGIPRVDVIVGGPPCQGFSVVGRARIRSLPREEQRREILGRNELYRNFFRFVEALRPLMFVIENWGMTRSRTCSTRRTMACPNPGGGSSSWAVESAACSVSPRRGACPPYRWTRLSAISLWCRPRRSSRRFPTTRAGSAPTSS